MAVRYGTRHRVEHAVELGLGDSFSSARGYGEALAPALVVAAEVVCWVAALFVGKMISRYHRFFDPRAWKGDR